MGEWLASAWGWLAPLLAATVLVPKAAQAIHKIWIRPIIRVQLANVGDCHVPTPLVDGDHNIVAQVMYLRLRIQNRGRTTIKDCFGNLVRMTVWDDGGRRKIFHFAREAHPLGWAHYSTSKQRNIPRDETYYLDVATLQLAEDRENNELIWWPYSPWPTSVIGFLQSLPRGKATYLFEIRVNADNARSRVVPVQFVFDPACSYLSLVPFDTRYPGWRWRWGWRRRSQSPQLPKAIS